MALGTTIKADTGLTDSLPFNVASLTSRWQQVVRPQIDPDTGDSTVGGGPNSADNSGSAITNAATQITNQTRRIIQRNGRFGTFFCARLGYDDGISSVTDCVIEVFGRYNSDDAWQKLYNLASTPAVAGTLATDLTNDAQDGTYGYTSVHPKNNVWDTMGCNEILVGVKTALAATGTVNTSFIEGRFI